LQYLFKTNTVIQGLRYNSPLPSSHETTTQYQVLGNILEPLGDELSFSEQEDYLCTQKWQKVKTLQRRLVGG